MKKEPQAPRPSSRPCPICGKPPVERYVPFCSKRCADVDLHKWLGGAYAVPSDDETDPADLEDLPPPPRDGAR